MEQEIIVQKLKPSSLLRPLLVGAALITFPFWIIGLIASILGGATINGEHVTGAPAVLSVLAFGLVFALTMGVLLWAYVSASLWAYSKWSAFRLRFVPR